MYTSMNMKLSRLFLNKPNYQQSHSHMRVGCKKQHSSTLEWYHCLRLPNISKNKTKSKLFPQSCTECLCVQEAISLAFRSLSFWTFSLFLWQNYQWLLKLFKYVSVPDRANPFSYFPFSKLYWLFLFAYSSSWTLFSFVCIPQLVGC